MIHLNFGQSVLLVLVATLAAFVIIGLFACWMERISAKAMKNPSDYLYRVSPDGYKLEMPQEYRDAKTYTFFGNSIEDTHLKGSDETPNRQERS